MLRVLTVCSSQNGRQPYRVLRNFAIVDRDGITKSSTRSESRGCIVCVRWPYAPGSGAGRRYLASNRAPRSPGSPIEITLECRDLVPYVLSETAWLDPADGHGFNRMPLHPYGARTMMNHFGRFLFAYAMPYQVFLALLVTITSTGPSFADDAPAHASPETCRAIAADADRLACYDELTRSDAWAAPCDLARHSAPDSGTPAERTSVMIVRIQISENKVRYFHTESGEVWKQTDRGSWNLAVPFQADLKPGRLGSFFLVTEGGKSARVKRVK